MSERYLLNWIRDLVDYLHRGGPFTEQVGQDLESIQERLVLLHQNYETDQAPEFADSLRDLMLEALQLTHDGVEDLLDYEEEAEPELLQSALAQIEEGNDILDSLKYALQQDTQWTSEASLG